MEKEKAITLEEALSQIENEQHREWIRMYLSGLSFDEIASLTEAQPNKISFMVKYYMQKLPPLSEDKYEHIYTKYNISLKDFCAVTEEEPIVFGYLSSKCTAGKRLAERLAHDAEIDKKLKERAQTYFDHRNSRGVSGASQPVESIAPAEYTPLNKRG